MLTAPAFVFGLGDTLRMPVTYRNPIASDGALGTPIDLTGKLCSGRLYTPGRSPIPLTTDNGGLVVTMANGLMSFVIGDDVSATLLPDPRAVALAEGYSAGFGGLFRQALAYPTRLRVQVRDPTIAPAPGDIGTIALFGVRLFDPATVDLASLPIGQAATVSASSGTPS